MTVYVLMFRVWCISVDGERMFMSTLFYCVAFIRFCISYYFIVIWVWFMLGDLGWGLYSGFRGFGVLDFSDFFVFAVFRCRIGVDII